MEIRKDDKKQLPLSLDHKTLAMHLFGYAETASKSCGDLLFSNSFVEWELMPRYWRGNGSKIEKSEASSSDLIMENRYVVDGQEVTCIVKPAIIKKDVNGTQREIIAFPSETEELIEKVLILIATFPGRLNQQDVSGMLRWGITFSLYEIYEELKKIRKTRSYAQIMESIYILVGSNTETENQYLDDGKVKKRTKSANFFYDYEFNVTGKGGARDKLYICFSDAVVEMIQSLKYRQMLYSRITSHTSSLSRFLDLYLSTSWENAENGDMAIISLNELFSRFGRANVQVKTKQRDIRVALKTLVDRDVIKRLPYAKKIFNAFGDVDYIYELEPTGAFVREIKLRNDRGIELEKLKADLKQI